MSQTETIELYGIALEVDFEYTAPDFNISDIHHRGESVMCLIGDYWFSQIRAKLARGQHGKA